MLQYRIRLVFIHALFCTVGTATIVFHALLVQDVLSLISVQRVRLEIFNVYGTCHTIGA